MRVGAVEAGDHRFRALLGGKRLAVARCGEENGLFPWPDADHFDGRIERQPPEAGGDADQELPAIADLSKLRGRGPELAKRQVVRGQCAVDEIIDRGNAEQLRALIIGPQHPREILGEKDGRIPAGEMLPHPCMHGNVDEGILSYGHGLAY